VYARMVTMTFEHGRWAGEGREWLEERLSGSGPTPGLHVSYWMFNRFEGKVVALAIYESVEALHASEERVKRTCAEVADRFESVTQQVEEFEIAATA
jgi:hypothetical protein